MRFGIWKGQRLSRTCNEQMAMSQKSGSQNHCDETCKTQKSSISWYLLCLPNPEQSILLACFEVLLYDNYTEHLHLARVDRQISFNRARVQTSPQYILCLAQSKCKKHHLSVILACSCGLSCLTKFSSPRSEGNLAAVSASALDRESIIDPPWHANAIVCEFDRIRNNQVASIYSTLYYFSWSLWYPHLEPLPGILPGIARIEEHKM